MGDLWCRNIDSSSTSSTDISTYHRHNVLDVSNSFVSLPSLFKSLYFLFLSGGSCNVLGKLCHCMCTKYVTIYSYVYMYQH